MPPGLVSFAHWTVKLCAAFAVAELVAFHATIWAVADGITAPQATLGAAAIAGGVGVTNSVLGWLGRREGKGRGEQLDTVVAAVQRVEQKVDDTVTKVEEGRVEAAQHRGHTDAAIESVRAEMRTLREELHEGLGSIRTDDRTRDDRIAALEHQARREAQP